jgi:hypothetical protein
VLVKIPHAQCDVASHEQRTTDTKRQTDTAPTIRQAFRALSHAGPFIWFFKIHVTLELQRLAVRDGSALQ